MSTKDRIIEAADALFYAHSIRETSVDKVAETAGVTKKTLYYHFRSKDDLIAAYLEARDRPTLDRYREWAGEGGVMLERLPRMFAALAEAAKSKHWRGCGFIRAAIELADTPGHPALAIARNHKTAFERWLKQDLSDDGYAEASQLARMVLILLDGAVARILVQGDTSYAVEAGTAAVRLLRSSPKVNNAKYTE